MTASVIYLQHALVQSKRHIEHVSPRSIQSLAPNWQRPHIALLNGKAVLRRDWGRQLHHGETLAFVDVESIPQGGGKGGSNPLQMILMLAVMVIAPQLAGMIAGEGYLGFGLTMYQVALPAVTMAGLMLVNALVPPPKLPSTQQASALAAPSPTYSIQAQGNAARLEASIPEHFGRLLAYPDYAAQPYSEYSSNDQYLYQLFCLGRGEYDIETIRIEDTPLSSFSEITYEVVRPGYPVTMFPTNVINAVEVSGQDMPCIAATYTQSGTTITVKAANHNLYIGSEVYINFTSGTAVDGNYTVTSTPEADTFTVTAAGSATITTSNATVATWIGPFTASGAGSDLTIAIAADFAAPRGLYIGTAGVPATLTLSVIAEARTVDESGTVFGSWFTLIDRTYSAATTTPQRNTERVGVAASRYQVRVRRVDLESTDSLYGHDVIWAGLRAYLPETANHGDVTLLAMRMLASNNLSAQASRKVNAIVTRKLPIWNGTTWSALTATRSIAWAMAYACKQVGLTDAQIDLATLLALDATWTTRGDHFDARFDNFLSFWEAASKIASAGRSKVYMQAGIVRIARDQSSAIPVQMYSMRNIVKGSFSIDYLMPTVDTADAVDVGYFDSSNWTPRRVRAKFSDSTAARPAKIELFGVTDRTHAWREGMYQAASNRYRRKIIKFQTEMEGFIPSFGDLISIQHDMPAWGQHAEVVATNYPGVGVNLTLSEPLVWGYGTHYIALRKQDGSVDGPYAVTPGATDYEVFVPTSLLPYIGGAAERTHIAFGVAEAWRQPARVIAIRPRGLTSVEIEAVNEDPSVHTADAGSSAPAVQYSRLIGYVNAPFVNDFSVSAGSPATTAVATWTASPYADHYIIERSNDGVTWTRLGITSQLTYSVTGCTSGTTRIRVAAAGVAKGPWVQALFGSSADYMWNAVTTTPMWNVVTTTPMWRY